MKAVVRGYHSPDVDLLRYVPRDIGELGVLVQLMIGPEDGPGEESFDILVCSPEWLRRRVNAEGPLLGLHHLVVDSWDYPRIQQFIAAMVEREHGSNWSELARRLSRIGLWEFEDYR